MTTYEGEEEEEGEIYCYYYHEQNFRRRGGLSIHVFYYYYISFYLHMCISQQYSYCCCCYHYSIVITWIYFVKSIDQTPPPDVHISCKTFAASTLIIFSHAFKTESFLILPLVESINSRTIARFVRVSSLDVVLLILITR